MDLNRIWMWNRIRAFLPEVALGAIAIRQFIIGDWFGGVVAIVLGILVYLNEVLYLGFWG